MALIDCPKCGQTISDRAKECPHCGEVLKSGITTSSVPLPPNPKNTNDENCQKKSNKTMRVFIFILLGLIVVGSLGYFVYDRYYIKEKCNAILIKGLDAERTGDYETAFKYYLQAADMGDPYAQYFVAISYETGFGVNQSSEEAVKWIIKAAEGGNPEAMYQYGSLLINGNYVTANHEEGIRWIKESAQKGNLSARSYLIQLGAQTDVTYSGAYPFKI